MTCVIDFGSANIACRAATLARSANTTHGSPAKKNEPRSGRTMPARTFLPPLQFIGQPFRRLASMPPASAALVTRLSEVGGPCPAPSDGMWCNR